MGNEIDRNLLRTRTRRWAGQFGLVMIALLVCLSLTLMLPSRDLIAAVTTQDATATVAGREQVSIPQPGQAQPEVPIVGRQPSENAPQGQGTDSATTREVERGQSASSGAGGSLENETSKHLKPPVVVERAPGTAEEELIYAFTDWALGFFPQKTENADFSLETNRQYVITQTGGQYEVRLAPFKLFIGEKDLLDLSPVVLNFQPRGKDRLAVTIHLPEKTPILTAEKTVAELTVGSQDISGIWDRTSAGFEQADLKLGNLAIQDSVTKGRLGIRELILGNLCTRDKQGLWDEKFHGNVSELSFVDEESTFNIGKIAGLFNLGGSDFARYAALKKSFQGTFTQMDEMKIPEMKEYFSNLDEYIQLLSTYTSSVLIKGIQVTSDGNRFNLDSVALSGGMHKEGQNGKIAYNSKVDTKGFIFTEKADPKKTQPVSTTLDAIGFVGEGSLKPIPPNMFSDLFIAIEGFEKVKKEESDAYLANNGTVFAKKILELIQGYSAEMNVNGLTVVNAMPHPVTLKTAKIAGGFDVGTGEGGTIHTLINFSGFNGMEQGKNNIPESANFNLELKKIPSLLKLIPDPSAVVTGNKQQMQGQMLMNGMNTLMMSALTLSLADSFVAFPASRLSLNLLAHIDNNAKYLSTGNLNVAIENPDEFMRIAKSFGADQDMQMMLTTITALANRTDGKGKIVDTIDAKIDQDGKVFINAKDVTLMFFPPPEQAQQAPGPQNAP